MIIRHLPFFAVVAEEENLQRAAERLGVTQPALSRRIQVLEAELGTPLFDRTSGRLKLTAVGELLGVEARRIVHEVDELTRAISGTHGVSRLTIGMNERAIANPVLSRAIGDYRGANRQVQLNVNIMSSSQQAEALREGQLDLAILYHDGADRFQSRELVEDDPFVIALPGDHRLAGFSTIGLAEMTDVEMIWPSSERVPLVFSELARIWKASGLEPKVTTQIYSAEAALWAVAAGLGVAVVRRSSTDHKPPGVVIRTMTELAEHRVPLHLAWLAKFDTPAMRSFRRMLADRNILRPE